MRTSETGEHAPKASTAAVAPQPPTCGMRVLRHRAWTAVLLRGELDLDFRRHLEAELSSELVRGKPVIVELAGLDFSDANGLRSLRRIVDRGASLDPPVPVELHGARGQVAGLIHRLGMDELADPSRLEGEAAAR